MNLSKADRSWTINKKKKKFVTEVADFSMCALDNQHLVPIKNTTGHNDHSVNDADNCVSFVHEAGFKVLNVEQQWKVIASPSVQTIRRNIKCWTVNK